MCLRCWYYDFLTIRDPILSIRTYAMQGDQMSSVRGVNVANDLVSTTSIWHLAWQPNKRLYEL